MTQARESLPCSMQQRLDPLVIHHLGAVDLGLEHEALSVHEDMALTALDLLTSVVTALFASHRGALERLAIHHARAGLGISFQANPEAFSDGPIDTLPGAVDTPSPKVVVDGGPSREVMGEQAPLAAAFEDVEDGLEDLTKVVDPGSSVSCGGGHVRLDVVPFGVGKIRRVRLSHAC